MNGDRGSAKHYWKEINGTNPKTIFERMAAEMPVKVAEDWSIPLIADT